MKNSITIFRQLLQLLPRNKFDQAVRKHKTDKYVKSFTSFQLLVVLLYAQITGKDSLRDILTGLSVHEKKLYHLGLSNVSRSNLCHAFNHRNYGAFEELFYHLLDQCSQFGRTKKFGIKSPIYALDSTKIDLCLSIFPWAKYRKRKGAMKLHHILDLKSDLPVFMVMTEARDHDMKVAKTLSMSRFLDSILVMDRGYYDFKWLYSLNKQGTTFVTRIKKNLKYRVLGQHSINEASNIMSDETIELTGVKSREDYPENLRLVTIYDEENDKILRFMTCNTKLAASTIGKLYKSRWQIESFFRWIKQNLKIKTFLGTSKNAVMLQVWAAMIYYLILSFLKFQTKSSWSLLEFSRRIKSTLFDNFSMLNLLSKNFGSTEKIHGYAVQLTLF